MVERWERSGGNRGLAVPHGSSVFLLVALCVCEVDLRPARGDGGEVRGVDVQCEAVAPGVEWADDAVGRDAITDHGAPPFAY